jgi:phosphopantothenoylcysteine decarboxylase/phosphopantothenate--cysteine ligase
MGYAIAQKAEARGHKTVLISGPSDLEKPDGARVIGIETALQMQKQIKRFIKWADCIIMASAVSDFRPASRVLRKIKSKKPFSLKLVKNPDILYNIGKEKRNKILVGFALESENLRKNAFKKLKQKNLDIIVANKIGKNSYPFGKGKTSVLIIDNSGAVRRLEGISKNRLAGILLDRVERLC